MRPLYSALLFEYQGLSSQATPLQPGGNSVIVVRDIDAYGNMDLFSTARLYVRGFLGETFVFLDWPSNTESLQSWRGRQVISAGTTWDLIVLGGGKIDVRISGYVLSV